MRTTDWIEVLVGRFRDFLLALEAKDLEEASRLARLRLPAGTPEELTIDRAWQSSLERMTESLRMRVLVGEPEGIGEGGELPKVPTHLFDQEPEVCFEGRWFAFTGKMIFPEGRKAMVKMTRDRGGCVKPKEALTPSTDYLVVGTHPEDGWVGGNYGTKIARALKYREQGKGILIFGEDHWLRAIGAGSVEGEVGEQ